MGRPSGQGAICGSWALEAAEGAPIYSTRMRLNRRFMYFIALLGLLHAYIGWRVVPDLGAPVRVAGAAVFVPAPVTMLVAPPAPRPPAPLQAARLARPGL